MRSSTLTALCTSANTSAPQRRFALGGTLSLFWSASGFFILGDPAFARRVFQGIGHAFTMRQISAKVNTAFVSSWAVTVLFFSIVVFSTGFSLATVFKI